jgi:hypothetical protein
MVCAHKTAHIIPWNSVFPLRVRSARLLINGRKVAGGEANEPAITSRLERHAAGADWSLEEFSWVARPTERDSDFTVKSPVNFAHSIAFGEALGYAIPTDSPQPSVCAVGKATEAAADVIGVSLLPEAKDVSAHKVMEGLQQVTVIDSVPCGLDHPFTLAIALVVTSALTRALAARRPRLRGADEDYKGESHHHGAEDFFDHFVT